MWGGDNGRLRLLEDTLVATARDPIVPIDLIARLDLRPGLELDVKLGSKVGENGKSVARRAKNKKKKRNSRGKLNPIDFHAQRVDEVIKIDGLDPDSYVQRRRFEDLTTVDPEPRLTLEYPGCPPACRLIDLFCPIGYGTRGMIVSPPKAGKTTLLQNIAMAISKNHSAVEVFALLIDERP